MRCTLSVRHGLVLAVAMIGLAACSVIEDDAIDPDDDAASQAVGLPGAGAPPTPYSADPLRAGTDAAELSNVADVVPVQAAPVSHQLVINNQSRNVVNVAEITVPNTTVGTGNVIANAPIKPGTSFTVTFPASAPCILNLRIGFGGGETRDYQNQNSCDRNAGMVTLNDMPVRQAPRPDQAMAAPQPLPAPVAPVPSQAPAAAPQEIVRKAPPVEKGGYMVQLGAFADLGEAKAAWQSDIKAHGDVLAGETPSFTSVTTATGQWIRLRIGPFKSAGDANQACDKIRAKKVDCLVAKS